jgi:hypothetical protein
MPKPPARMRGAETVGNGVREIRSREMKIVGIRAVRG